MTPAAPAPQKRRFGLAPLAAALAALLIVIAGGAWWFLNANRPASVATKAPAEAARLSIVVLPFANLSGDPGQDYLVDALTDELTTSSRAHPRHLRHRAQHGHDLQGQAGRRQGDRQGSGRALCSRRLGAAERRSDEGQRPAHRRRAAALTSGPNNSTRPAPICCRRRTRSSRIWRTQSTFSSPQAEAARLKRTPAANRDAEDLALQCHAGQWKAGSIGKEADAAYALCEQALAIDPNNVRALMALGVKFFMPAALGVSGDPKGDLERADELASKALALDPDWTWNHDLKGDILRFQARYQEAVAEHERALALDPSNVDAAASLGWDYVILGEFDKSLEYFDKAILASPYDPGLAYWYGGKAWANFGLKNYDQAIELGSPGDRDQSELRPVYSCDPRGGARLDRS